MRKSKAQKALEQVAAREGVSVEEVRAEIQTAIDFAMSSPDPAVQAQWKDVPYRGDKPTPEDVILFLTKQMQGR